MSGRAILFVLCGIVRIGSSLEGLSSAGLQLGMEDLRSSLVAHVFRVWDCLEPSRCGASDSRCL